MFFSPDPVTMILMIDFDALDNFIMMLQRFTELKRVIVQAIDINKDG